MNKARLIDEFVKLVSIDSPSLGEREMGDYMAGRLKALGFSVTEDDAGVKLGGNCGNIYAVLPGSLPADALLFCAHLDTVEPSRGKRAVLHEDGVITSGGDTVLGADDCAALAVILEALQAIREQGLPHRTIELALMVAEEIYCGGSARFDFSRVRSRECYVLDLTGPVGTAAYQAPTVITFEAQVLGKSAHAGFNPEEGVHAIAAAAEAVAGLQMGRVDENTTFNIGVIQGGLAGNIVPERCIVRGEARSFVHEKAVRQAQLAREHFERSAARRGAAVEFTSRCGCQAYETPLSHRVVKRFEQACRSQGLSPVLQRTFGGSDNNYFAQHGIAGIVVATAMNNCHSCGEYTTQDELLRAAGLTASLMTSEN
jgi:peptidase T-like protein